MKTRVHHTKQEHREFLLSAAILHFSEHKLWPQSLFIVNDNAPEDRKLSKGIIYTHSKEWLKEATDLYKLIPEKPTDNIESFANIKEDIPKTSTNTLEQLLDTISENVVELLFQKISNNLTQKIKDYLKNQETSPEFEIKEETQTELKKKILVVGLLPVQQHEITKAYGEIFRLKYHESTENIHRLEDRVKWSDIVILNCTKISHTHQEMVKKFAGNREIKLVFGGTSGIKGTIEGIKFKWQTLTNT